MPIQSPYMICNHHVFAWWEELKIWWFCNFQTMWVTLDHVVKGYVTFQYTWGGFATSNTHTLHVRGFWSFPTTYNCGCFMKYSILEGKMKIFHFKTMNKACIMKINIFLFISFIKNGFITQKEKKKRHEF